MTATRRSSAGGVEVGPAVEEVGGEGLGVGEGGEVAGLELVGGEAEAGGERRSSVQSRNRVGTSGQAASGHGFSNGVPDWARRCRELSATTSGGTSWRNSSAGSLPVTSRPWRRASSSNAACWPLRSHQ